MRVCIDTHIKQTFLWQLGSLNLVTVSTPGNDNAIVITQNALVLRRHKQKYSGVTCRDVWDSLSNSSAKMEEEREGACQTDPGCSPPFPCSGSDTAQVIWPQSPLPAPPDTWQTPSIVSGILHYKNRLRTEHFFCPRHFLHVEALNQPQPYEVIATLTTDWAFSIGVNRKLDIMCPWLLTTFCRSKTNQF